MGARFEAVCDLGIDEAREPRLGLHLPLQRKLRNISAVVLDYLDRLKRKESGPVADEDDDVFSYSKRSVR